MFKYIRKVMAGYLENERTITYLQCVCKESVKGAALVNVLKKFPRKWSKYAYYKAYRMTLLGYPLSTTINELNYLKETIQGE